MAKDMLGFDPAKITHPQKISAIRRELGLRRHVYQRRVAAGQMTQNLADREITVMEAILADYEQGRVRE